MFVSWIFALILPTLSETPCLWTGPGSASGIEFMVNLDSLQRADAADLIPESLPRIYSLGLRLNADPQRGLGLPPELLAQLNRLDRPVRMIISKAGEDAASREQRRGAPWLTETVDLAKTLNPSGISFDLGQREPSLGDRALKLLQEELSLEKGSEEWLAVRGASVADLSSFFQGSRRPWIAQADRMPRESVEMLSYLALASGASRLALQDQVADEDTAWIWDRLAPLRPSLPSASLMASGDLSSPFFRAFLATNIPLAPQGPLDPSCRILFVVGHPDPPPKDLLDRVRGGLSICFLSCPIQDAGWHELLQDLEVRASLGESMPSPSFILSSPQGKASGWYRLESSSLDPPSHLPSKRCIEALSPDGREAGWSWRHGQGTITLFASVPSEGASVESLRDLISAVAASAGCRSAVEGPEDLIAGLMTAHGRDFLLLVPAGIQDSLQRFRMRLPWAQSDRTYVFWSQPGGMWMGHARGDEVARDGMAVTLPSGKLTAIEVNLD